MCLSPEKMSDERLAKAATYWRNAAREEEAAGDPDGDARRWNSKADNFEALLAERAVDMEEIFAAAIVEKPVPELVAV